MLIDQAIQTLKTIKHDAYLHDQPTAEQAIDLAIQALEDTKTNMVTGYITYIHPSLLRACELYVPEAVRKTWQRAKE